MYPKTDGCKPVLYCRTGVSYFWSKAELYRCGVQRRECSSPMPKTPRSLHCCPARYSHGATRVSLVDGTAISDVWVGTTSEYPYTPCQSARSYRPPVQRAQHRCDRGTLVAGSVYPGCRLVQPVNCARIPLMNLQLLLGPGNASLYRQATSEQRPVLRYDRRQGPLIPVGHSSRRGEIRPIILVGGVQILE